MIPPTPDIRTTLVLRRTFAADRPRVFRAWIEPEALQRWLKPNGLNLRVQSLDARVDGSFHFDLENGTSIIGTYLDLVPPEKLVFTWINQAQPEQGTVVTVDFREQGSSTEVVLTHRNLRRPELRVRVERGWGLALDTLAEVLSSAPTK
ncbi:MAG: hypothetical protein C5B60_08205 [Chloroflexi bacterium]|nr:MAG: hypothetical protein C5B60_08205 [Chloroflexota bacterium]